MKIKLFTEKIDKTFYRQLILQYIADQLSGNPRAFKRYTDFHDNWTIQIYPTTAWDGNIEGGSEQIGTFNPEIPHGVTGEGIVKVYVSDTSDKGLRAVQNFGAIFHELAHMLLIILARGQRGIFRNNDLSGNKKGQEANVSTQEVHDRQMEGKTYLVKGYVNFGTWFSTKWTPYTCVGLDLRDFINTL